jgi:hypothetical protein
MPHKVPGKYPESAQKLPPFLFVKPFFFSIPPNLLIPKQIELGAK